MTRKLKTFQTSLGFFDQAIAAPSMKAALEAWGAESNLFHQGIAKETTDPAIVAATMAAPGVVLKRPVGSSGEFKEHADLPTDIANNGGRRNDARRSADRKQGKRAKSSRNATSDRKAVFAYDREERRRDRKRAKEEAVREKDRERRQAAIDAAQEALESARKEYEADVAKIQIEIEALQKRAETKAARWHKKKSRLAFLLRRARK